MKLIPKIVREKKEEKKSIRESLISQIEEFEGFRENKISRTESIKRFHISRKGLKFAKSRNCTLLRYIIFEDNS